MAPVEEKSAVEKPPVEDDDDDKKLIPLYSLLPQQVRRRLKSLKKLQYEAIVSEGKFFEEVHKLECRYASLFAQYYIKRENIIKGTVEPTDEDCDFSEGYESPDDDDPGILELRQKLSITKQVEEGATGIPEFWLTVLKNAEMTCDMIRDHDEPILRHLIDIKLVLQESEPMGFKIVFAFSKNPYFTNSVLTKEYEMNFMPDRKKPWEYDGPEIVRVKGCNIDWLKGMDVTEKTIQKKQKNKTTGSQIRTVIKTVPNDSFFNFFKSIDIDISDETISDEIRYDFDNDCEVASFLRDKLIPRAVLYYTGEALEDESSTEESSSSSSHSGDDNEDECLKTESEDMGSGDAGSDVE